MNMLGTLASVACKNLKNNKGINTNIKRHDDAGGVHVADTMHNAADDVATDADDEYNSEINGGGGGDDYSQREGQLFIGSLPYPPPMLQPHYFIPNPYHPMMMADSINLSSVSSQNAMMNLYPTHVHNPASSSSVVNATRPILQSIQQHQHHRQNRNHKNYNFEQQGGDDVNDDDHEEEDDDDELSDAIQSKRAKARQIARSRRARKIQEAETLTREITELLNDYECALKACDFTLTSPIDKKILEEQMAILSETTNGMYRYYPLTCKVCGEKFKRDIDVADHLVKYHAITALKSTLENESELTSSAASPSATSSTGTGEGVTSTISTIATTSAATATVSGTNDKKRSRLEKNALSARLSRQRKKHYILLLQTQIPVLKLRIEKLKACMPPKTLKLALTLKSTSSAAFPKQEGLFPYEIVHKLLYMRQYSEEDERASHSVLSPDSSDMGYQIRNGIMQSNADENGNNQIKPVITAYRSSVSTTNSSEVV